MVGKNNHRVRFEKSTNKFKRFTLKKLSVGVASVAIGAGFVIGSGEVAQAEEVSPEQALEKAPTASVEEALTSEPKQGQEATSTEISIEEPAQENTQAGEVSSESTTEENADIEGNVAEPDQTRE
ncbi:YSIRK-type signal peptide-containing protein [Aerococcaceae bacterium DSM 111020]|nr:YSIRK-type signal peptide-containing protein [Aerococcaceae bacterium DSM 111020]